MHELNTSKTVKKYPWRSLLPVKSQIYSLYRSSFVDTSDRDIILKQKLVNITVESENKNQIWLGKPSVFKVKSSIESKKWLVFWKRVDFESVTDVSIYETYIGKTIFTHLLALISMSNLAFVKWRWTFTPFFNFFLFL